jgi:hypothetical protein
MAARDICHPQMDDSHSLAQSRIGANGRYFHSEQRSIEIHRCLPVVSGSAYVSQPRELTKALPAIA